MRSDIKIHMEVKANRLKTVLGVNKYCGYAFGGFLCLFGFFCCCLVHFSFLLDKVFLPPFPPPNLISQCLSQLFKLEAQVKGSFPLRTTPPSPKKHRKTTTISTHLVLKAI